MQGASRNQHTPAMALRKSSSAVRNLDLYNRRSIVRVVTTPREKRVLQDANESEPFHYPF